MVKGSTIQINKIYGYVEIEIERRPTFLHKTLSFTKVIFSVYMRVEMGCSSKKFILVLLFLYWSPVSAVKTSKHIDWYTERCHDGNQTLCDEAYKFAVVDAPDLVDGLMPCCSMMQIDAPK